MYYPLELPRPRRPLYKAGQLMSQKRKQNGIVKGILLPYLKEYCSFSSVHGIRYLTDPKLRYFERIIWLLLVLATSIGAIIVYVDLNNLYHSMRIQTTVKDSMRPVFYQRFPSVGFCPRNRVNWSKLENEAVVRFLGANASIAHRELFINFFIAASDIHLSRLKNLADFFENDTLAGSVSNLNDLNISEVLRFVQLNCSDLFDSCRWRGRLEDCCNILEVQHTESGICWVFNSQISPAMRKRAMEDKFYPRRTPQYGEGTGLDVFMSLNKSLIRYNKRGLYLMIKHPAQWSEVARYIKPDAHTRLSMLPRFTTTDIRTRSVEPSVRRCIFPDETEDPNYKNFPGFTYWLGNCRSRCRQEYVYKICKCSPSLLFPVIDKDNFPDCKASDFKCLYDHRELFSADRNPMENDYVDNSDRESMVCDCFISCTQLIYEQEYTTTALDANETDAGKGAVHLDIFFKSAWYILYQTHMRFSFVELLASFGGIIGLFLGASLLSAVELAYYSTIGLYLYVRDKREALKKKTLELSTPPISVQFRHKITPSKIIY